MIVTMTVTTMTQLPPTCAALVSYDDNDDQHDSSATITSAIRSLSRSRTHLSASHPHCLPHPHTMASREASLDRKSGASSSPRAREEDNQRRRDDSRRDDSRRDDSRRDDSRRDDSRRDDSRRDDSRRDASRRDDSRRDDSRRDDSRRDDSRRDDSSRRDHRPSSDRERGQSNGSGRGGRWPTEGYSRKRARDDVDDGDPSIPESQRWGTTRGGGTASSSSGGGGGSGGRSRSREDADESAPKKPKLQPSFELSGALAAESLTHNGVVLKVRMLRCCGVSALSSVDGLSSLPRYLASSTHRRRTQPCRPSAGGCLCSRATRTSAASRSTSRRRTCWAATPRSPTLPSFIRRAARSTPPSSSARCRCSIVTASWFQDSPSSSTYLLPPPSSSPVVVAAHLASTQAVHYRPRQHQWHVHQRRAAG